MGFLAVVAPLAGDKRNTPPSFTFEVEQLDVNIWLLPLLFGRFEVYCDIGIRIKAGPQPVPHFDIAIPFKTNEHSLVDLSPTLSDAETAALVFGETVVDERGNSLDANSNFGLRKSIQSDTGSEQIENLSSDTFSLWQVALTTALEPNEVGYVRFRFRTTGFSRTLQWRRSVFRRVGAIFDLHFYDERAAALVVEGKRYKNNMIPAKKLNVFFIVKSSFTERTVSPNLRYLRVLEGKKWESYLNRATGMIRGGKHLVHYWRSKKEVKPEDDYRAFLDLAWRTDSIGWPTFLALVVASGLSSQFFRGTTEGQTESSPFVKSLGAILDLLGGVPDAGVLGWVGGGLVGLLVFLLSWIILAGEAADYGPKALRWCVRKFQSTEAWMYNIRRTIGKSVE